jgi:hypothetical protein
VVAVKGLRNCKIKDMSCIRMKKIDLLLDWFFGGSIGVETQGLCLARKHSTP